MDKVKKKLKTMMSILKASGSDLGYLPVTRDDVMELIRVIDALDTISKARDKK